MRLDRPESREGDRIKATRESRCLSVRRLARLSGVSRSQIYKLEAGQNRARDETLKKLRAALAAAEKEEP
jgi:transcriptional regulator with XRE-family HTH domain